MIPIGNNLGFFLNVQNSVLNFKEKTSIKGKTFNFSTCNKRLRKGKPSLRKERNKKKERGEKFFLRLQRQWFKDVTRCRR